MRPFYFLPTGAALPARSLCSLLTGLLLALLPLLTHAATPVLRLETTVTASDVTAFVDRVEIIDATTGLPVRNAVPNAGFETTGSLGAGSYGYNPTGASWSFVNNSGIVGNGSLFNNPNAPEGSRAAFLQSGTPGYFSQTLPNLVPGLYRVRLRVAQRNTSPANQGVRVLVDGVALGTVVPANNGTFAMYNSGTFAVARPSTSDIFAGGATLNTPGGTALSVVFTAAPAVTDVDGDGLLDLLVGSSGGTVTRYEQTAANGNLFADLGLLTTNGSTAVAVGQSATPAVTDVDGDGLLDLLVGEYVGTVTRFEQTVANGDQFASAGLLTTTGGTAISSGFQTYSHPTVTDVDGDGLLDLLLGKSNGTVGRYEQTTLGGSGFDPLGDLTTGSGTLNGGTMLAPAVTDVDGDGLLDLLTGNFSPGTVRRFEQTAANGDQFALVGTLTTDGSNALNASSSSFNSPALADVDGDGRLDLLVGGYTGNVRRYEQAELPTALALAPQAVAENAVSGTVVGTFSTTDPTSGDTFTYTLVAGTNSTDNASFAIGSGANAGKLVTAAVFDFETKSSYTVRVRTTDATGLFTEQAFTISITDVGEPPLLTSFSPASGPLGTVITITGQNLTGLTSVLLGDVPAAFTVVSSTSVTVTVPRQATSQKLRISRTSGLAAGQGTVLSATAFTVTRPNTSGIFAGGAMLTTNGSTAIDVGLNAVPVVCDLDGDGLLDVLVGGLTGVDRFEQTTANGLVLASAGRLTTNGSTRLTNYGRLAVSDLDGDGLLDLLLGQRDGYVERYEQATAGGTVFPLVALLTTDGSTALDVGDEAAPALCDLDGDGLLDMLVGDYYSSTVLRYEQTTANGNVFAPQGTVKDYGGYTLYLNSSPVPTVSDLDGDGLLDMLVGDSNGYVQRYEQVSVNSNRFAGLGNVTTNGSAIIDVGLDSAPLITDLDGDGELDLLVGDFSGNVYRYEQAAPPTALALVPAAVAENAASGTVVGTFSTTDGTSGDTFTYTLAAGGADNAQFAIGTGANAGQLLTAAVFNYEAKSSYSIRVRVTDATGIPYEQTLAISITDVPDSPSITGLAPDNGPVGTSVTLTGTNFGGATAVTVNGTAGSITANTGTSLSFTVAAGSTTGTVVLSTPNGNASTTPVLRLQATGGSGGDRTIYLDQVEIVTTGGAVVPGAVANSSFETGPAGALNFTPTTATPWTFTPNGGNVAIATSASAYAPPAPPNGSHIALFQAAGGAIEQALNLGAGTYQLRCQLAQRQCCSGAPYNQALQVYINGVAVGAALTTSGAGYVQVLSVPFTVAAGLGVFTVIQPPTLTSLSAAAELPGQAVVLTGTSFTSSSTVSFGGVAASSVTFTSPTSLTAVVPVGAAVGSSAVVLTNTAGSTPASPAFEVLQVYRSTAASGCLSTASLTLTGSGGAGSWRYLRLPGAGGAVVAAIEDTRNLGTVSAGFQALGTATGTAVRQDGRGRRYLDRNFFLTATNQTFTGQSVRVRFFGLSSELSRLTAVDGNAATLKASQYDGPNEDCDLTNNSPTADSRLLAAPATVVAGTDWFTAQVSVADHFSEFYLTGASAPLPVELLAFSAEKQGSTVALAWRTASEKNADRFEVERSRDGGTFERIGSVAAQGSVSSPSDYAFVDSKYPGETNVLYYRLHQFDLDGTASYSPVRAVAVGEKVLLTLYPNPARAAVTVGGIKAGATVAVLDALGRVVARATSDADGTARLTLPAGLAAGVYVVRSGSQASRLAVE